MGSQSFTCSRYADSITANQAFEEAQEEARYNYGHSGYTGTIAEKMNFVEMPMIEGKTPQETAWHYIRECDPKIDDKWGPAGCVKGKDHEGHEVYCFFGWASC